MSVFRSPGLRCSRMRGWSPDGLRHGGSFKGSALSDAARKDLNAELRRFAWAEDDHVTPDPLLLEVKGVGRAAVRLDADRLPWRRRRVDHDVRELLRVEVNDGLHLIHVIGEQALHPTRHVRER